MAEDNYYDKYLDTKHAFDNVNQTLKSIVNHEEEMSKEDIIKLLKKCNDYFKEKVTFK